MRGGPALLLGVGVGVAVALAAAPARADGSQDDADHPLVDLRLPFGFGWAYSGGMRSPALSDALIEEVDLYRVHRRLALGAVLSVDGLSRPDIEVPEGARSPDVVGVLFGGDVFWRPPGGTAFGLSAALGPVFRAGDVLGLALATRLEVWPRYQDIDEALACDAGPVVTYVAGALSFWAEARVDFSDQRGGTLAFGGAYDLARGVFLPVLGALFRKACSRR